MTLLGEYPLDSFQFFFPPGLKISSYLKLHYQGSKNFRKNCVPVIYSDDCKNTAAVLRLLRHHVLSPESFGHTPEDLNWSCGNKGFLIPSEQMELRVVIQGSSLKFIIIPQGQGSEQYHIEFANIKSFLSRENFMVLHLKYLDFMDLKLKLKPHIDSRARLNVNYVTEQAQIGKELIKYSVIPVQRYSFNISKFKYVADLLRHNQAKISAPIVSYNSTMAQGQGVSSPILKFGRALTSFSTGKPLCRVQIILMITHPNFKKNAESAAIFSENEPDQDANNDIFFEVKTGDFLNMVDTYTEKFGPLYLC